MINDTVLLEFRKGNLEPLYKRLFPTLLLFAYKYLGDKNEFLAKDFVQNSILKAWEKKDSINSYPSLKSFLYVTIRNEIISSHRKIKVREKHAHMMKDDEMLDFKNKLIETETQQLLYNAINSLSEREKKIFEMSFIDGMKNVEIAEILNVSDSTVKKQKAKALEQLRGKLKPFLGLFLMLRF